MPLDPVELLAELIAIPSVNPMGRPAEGPTYYEARLTDCLENIFGRLGLPCQRQLVEKVPGRPPRENIVARLDGSPENDRVLLLEAHQDTVPVDGMTIEPFSARIEGGRVYGRGACDIKGGMAAMLAALSRLAEEPADHRPTVMLACTVNEEYGFSGAKILPQLWQTGVSSIFPKPPDACIVAEPTELAVVVAHKGVLRWRCHTHGHAAHSSRPELGENAIYRMGEVLGEIEHYQRDVLAQLGEHPLCGRPTLSVGLIHGGLSVNTVPETCTIEIDRRLVPGEKPAAAYAHLVDHLSEAFSQRTDVNLTHDEPYLTAPGLMDKDNRALADWAGKLAQECGGRGGLVGAAYATNAPAIAAAGVPTIVFGPGSIAQAHTADESLELEQLRLAAEIYYRLGNSWS